MPCFLGSVAVETLSSSLQLIRLGRQCLSLSAGDITSCLRLKRYQLVSEHLYRGVFGLHFFGSSIHEASKTSESRS